jgi:tRNA C32,U32 (ribose-2'-O)-methylase TrmJ
MRSLRSLVFRSAPDARELDLLRAMAIEVKRTTDRLKGADSSAESANSA